MANLSACTDAMMMTQKAYEAAMQRVIVPVLTTCIPTGFLGTMSKALTPILLLGICSAAQAEPGPSVRLLMNRPVSLFSWGLYRLDLEIERTFGRTSGGFEFRAPLTGRKTYPTSVVYDWAKNRIIIRLYSAKRSDNAEEECKQLLESIRSMSSISSDLPHSFFAQFFMPKGFERDELNAAAVEIDKLFEFVFETTRGRLKKDDFRCSAPLAGFGYSGEGYSVEKPATGLP